MAYKPILGQNVKRFDEQQPETWNEFFRNASEIFDVPADKVMPFDASISFGDLPNWRNLRIDTWEPQHQGATIPAGDLEREGKIAISDSTKFPFFKGGNTAEHEYMHNIDTHFADHKKGMYGKSPSREYQRGILTGSLPTNSSKSRSEMYEDYNWQTNSSGYRIPATPLSRYLAAPEVYEDELAKSITGYGGRDGDYEFQMMKDSWEKRGPRNQYYTTLSETDRSALMEDLERQTIGMTPASRDHFINTEMARHYFLDPRNIQQKALEDAFINNPRNDRLGEAKELIAPMVAQALSDDDYDNRVSSQYSTPRGAQVYATDEDGNVYETAMIPSYTTHYVGGPLDQRRADPNFAYEIRNEPAAYLNSVSERFARLGGQYMKEDRSLGTGGYEFNPVEFSADRPNKELSFVQDDFRKAMNILLNR